MKICLKKQNIFYSQLAASPRRRVQSDYMHRRPPYSRLRRSVIDLPYDIGFSPLFRNPHNKLSIISSNIYLEKVIRSSVVSYWQSFAAWRYLFHVFLPLPNPSNTLTLIWVTIYQKLHTFRNNMTRIYVFNIPRAVLCSSALLIDDLSVFHKH